MEGGDFMKLNYRDDWDIIKKRLTMLWDNEILDRPCVAVQCPKDKNNPFNTSRPWGKETLKDYYMNPECILERSLDRFEKTYYAGDAYPVIFPYWGTGGHAKYLELQEVFEKNTNYAERTIWMNPVIEEYEDFKFEFDFNNPVFQSELRAMKYLADEGKGKFFVSMPDNCGSYDGLAALRGNQEFIFDLYDQPDEVKKAGNKIVDTLIQSGNAMFDVLKNNNDGGSVHRGYNTWSPGKHMQLQCDLSVMISSDMFEEFIMEELERTTEWLDHSIYHLDGIEQTRFLDQLLSVRKLNMIQWSRVAGQPGIMENFHYIRKIQEAGKGIIIELWKHELDAILDNVSPKGRILIVWDAEDPKEAEDIVEYVNNHSFKKKLF